MNYIIGRVERKREIERERERERERESEGEREGTRTRRKKDSQRETVRERERERERERDRVREREREREGGRERVRGNENRFNLSEQFNFDRRNYPHSHARRKKSLVNPYLYGFPSNPLRSGFSRHPRFMHSDQETIQGASEAKIFDKAAI